MKRIYILLICALLQLPIYGQQAQHKVIYKKKSLVQLKNKNDRSIATQMLLETYDKMEDLEYSLYFTNEESIFKQIEQMGIDGDHGSMASVLSRITGDTKGVYFVDKNKSKTYHQRELEGDLFLVDCMMKDDWVLTQEVKKIGAYTCYKAIKDDTYLGSSGNIIPKKIVAWYTPELPYSFGPICYNGLPGLIVQLENQKTLLYVKEVHLNIKEPIHIERPKGELISREAFYKKMLGDHGGFKKPKRRKRK